MERDALMKWTEETKADEIGPSTLKALEAIRSGKDIKEAGSSGTTCGSAMRIGAVALTTPLGDYEELRRRVYASTVITHNTNVAMEATMAIGYALHTAMLNTSVENIMNSTLKGADIGKESSTFEYVGASTGERIALIRKMREEISEKEKWLDFLYDVIGCGMAANEVVPTSIGIFLFSPQSPWECVKMGASIGGDTDTIAALSGMLSTLYNRGHDIPEDIVEYVLKVNLLVVDKYAAIVCDMNGKR